MKTHRYYKQKYVKWNDNANTKKNKKAGIAKKVKKSYSNTKVDFRTRYITRDKEKLH